MRISIIVPVLNEAPQIQPFLRHLRARARHAEIVVADGGSDDGTADLARGMCDQLITTDRGRGPQMNAGALHSLGEVLWFLHADNEISAECIPAILTALRDKKLVGGCFRIRIPRPEPVFRVHDGLAHYLGKHLRVRCGDHGFFVRRDVFQELGGYANVPLMEDAIFFRAMQRKGRIAWLPTRLLLSSRRHEQVGVYRYTLVCAFIVALFCLRLSPHHLAKVYRWLVPARESFRPLKPVEDELFKEFRGN